MSNFSALENYQTLHRFYTMYIYFCHSAPAKSAGSTHLTCKLSQSPRIVSTINTIPKQTIHMHIEFIYVCLYTHRCTCIHSRKIVILQYLLMYSVACASSLGEIKCTSHLVFSAVACCLVFSLALSRYAVTDGKPVCVTCFSPAIKC